MRATVLYKPGNIRHRLVTTFLSLATSGCAGPSLAADAESSPLPSGDTGSPHQAAPMKLRITIEDAVLTANLEDNAATRDLVSLLPLTSQSETTRGPASDDASRVSPLSGVATIRAKAASASPKKRSPRRLELNPVPNPF